VILHIKCVGFSVVVKVCLSGAWGGVVGWSTALQAGRSIRFALQSLRLFV